MRSTYDISVVIPVYNKETTIQIALESVFRQTKDNVEIICVDDGSTDRSADLIRGLQKGHDNLRLIRQKNKGAGPARNTGINNAHGEYIAFLDPDDEFANEYSLENAYDLVKKTGLLTAGGQWLIFSDNRLIERRRIFRKAVDDKEFVIKDYRDIQFSFGFYSFIYNTEFLREHGCYFPALRRFQDAPFCCQTMYKMIELGIGNFDFYKYNASNKTSDFSIGQWLDILDGIKSNLEYALRNALKILWKRTLYHLNIEFADSMLDATKTDKDKIISKLTDIQKLVQEKGDDLAILSYLNSNDNESLDTYKMLSFLQMLFNVPRERVILYGAGKYGRCVKKINDLYHLFDMVDWIDGYKAGEMIEGYEISPVDTVIEGNYDKIFITVINDDNIEDITTGLHEYGIEDDKIVDFMMYAE